MAKTRSAPRQPARALATKPPMRRMFWALGRLRANRTLKATDLAAEFEVTVRTAYRDLDFMRDEWRVPMEFDRQQQTFLLTGPLTDVPPVTLSQGELVGLYFAEKVLRQYRGTPFEADVASAFHKIEDLLPAEVKVSPSQLTEYLSLDLGPIYGADAGAFRDVLTALRLKRTALIRYRSASSGRTTARRIRPYHVFNVKGDWYLAAYDERRAAVRDFALHRIRRITLTTDPYEVPSTWTFAAYMADAFGIEKGGKPVQVGLRFAPRQARWIRDRKWHRSARMQEELGGGLILRMKVAETSELRRFVQQFGAEVEVLEPASLRRAVAEELRAALRPYAAPRKRGRS